MGKGKVFEVQHGEVMGEEGEILAVFHNYANKKRKEKKRNC